MGTADFIYEAENEIDTSEKKIKEVNKDCPKCKGVGIDHYGNPCICRY